MISRPLLYVSGGLLLALAIACGLLWWHNRSLQRENANLNDQLNTLADANQHQAKTIAGLHAEIDHRDAAYEALQARDRQRQRTLANAKAAVAKTLDADRCAHQRMPGPVVEQLRDHAAGHQDGNSKDSSAGVHDSAD